MIDDTEIEADVARLREKWFGAGAEPPKALDAEEEAIAARWLGKNEAAKLARTAGGKKYRPPIVVAHFGYAPEVWVGSHIAGGWFVETFSGGIKHTIFQGERDGCLQAVSRLQRMGITVTRVGKEEPPPEERAADKAPVRSKKFDMIDALRGFRRDDA